MVGLKNTYQTIRLRIFVASYDTWLTSTCTIGQPTSLLAKATPRGSTRNIRPKVRRPRVLSPHEKPKTSTAVLLSVGILNPRSGRSLLSLARLINRQDVVFDESLADRSSRRCDETSTGHRPTECYAVRHWLETRRQQAT